MQGMYWTRHETYNGRDGIRVRNPMKGVAMIEAEQAAHELSQELLDQNPIAILAPDGAHEWFFEFKPR